MQKSEWLKRRFRMLENTIVTPYFERMKKIYG